VRATTPHLRILEERFPHLVGKDEEGGGRSFRSSGGAEIFRLEADGRRLRLPVPRKVLDDLFGGLPFPVESSDRASIVPLPDVGEPELVFALIEALEEQAGASRDQSETEAAARARPGTPRAASRIPTRLLRIALAAIALLLALFLGFSWKLAQKSLDQDREQWIETLLRR
jgi:hypothetical protein